jgi:hypothetical protein
MRMPNFTAEASIYRANGRYQAAPVVSHSTARVVVPAAFCNNVCLRNCRRGCLNLVGSAKGDCLRECPSVCCDF